MARAMTRLNTPFPSAVMIAMARSAGGTAIKASTILINTVSTFPPMNPAIPPIIAPNIKAIAIMAIPHSKDILPP